MRESLIARVGALVASVLVLSACGRYAPPVSPEVTSPQSVEVVEVSEVAGESQSGVAIKWLAPDKDFRGEPLKELWGYKVYRLEGELPLSGNVGLQQQVGVALSVGANRWDPLKARAQEPSLIKFEKIGEVKDETMDKLRALQKKARQEGQVERKVKLSREDRLVSFVDRGFKPGGIQSYKIVPFNSSFVEPEVDKILQVKPGGVVGGGVDGAALQFELVGNPEFSEPLGAAQTGFDDELMED